jgi:hypothetical protein
VEIPTANAAPAFTNPTPEKKGGMPVVKILFALVALGIVVIGLIAIVGVVIYFSTTGPGSNQTTKKVSPTAFPVSSPTIDSEKQRLQDELANAQKKLDEQKNANHSVNLPPPFPSPERTNEPGVVTARVNSPGDGFLAMRSAPSAEYGERLAKIPHGAVVDIQNCQRERVRIGVRTGRWCMVIYGNNTGWVFDAWLDY